jgi:hypothetical protein
MDTPRDALDKLIPPGATPAPPLPSRPAVVEETEPSAPKAEDLVGDITNMLLDAVRDAGKDLAKSAEKVAHYTATRAQHLARIHNEPGWRRAVMAERDSVALFAGIAVVGSADVADARILGIIEGVLTALSLGLSRFASGNLL